MYRKLLIHLDDASMIERLNDHLDSIKIFYKENKISYGSPLKLGEILPEELRLGCWIQQDRLKRCIVDSVESNKISITPSCKIDEVEEKVKLILSLGKIDYPCSGRVVLDSVPKIGDERIKHFRILNKEVHMSDRIYGNDNRIINYKKGAL